MPNEADKFVVAPWQIFVLPEMLTEGDVACVTVTLAGLGQKPAAVGVAVYVPAELTVMLWLVEPVDHCTEGVDEVKVTVCPGQRFNVPLAVILTVEPARCDTVIRFVVSEQDCPGFTMQ